ncbi:MAG TPA: sigma-70 family RNA polymerase sigma factor [Anaerolineae bacterium]|nr:sigma-70 family RNA polymerase sigma factor [Anaerolineae bacterium]
MEPKRLETELRERCHRYTLQTLADRGWQLVQDETGFVAEVWAEVGPRLVDAPQPALKAIVEHATIKCYGRLWHAACRATGTARQRRAFEELFTFLYRVAYNRANYDQYLAEECAQQALLKIWQNCDRIEDPGSFMWWALRIVNNEVNRAFARGSRRVHAPSTGQNTWQDVEISWSDLQVEGDDSDAGGHYLTGSAHLNGTAMNREPVMTADIRARLETAIRDCLDNERHRAVIIKTFLEAKSREEVARELDTTPQIVSVFKQRGLKHLEACEDFVAVLEELL